MQVYIYVDDERIPKVKDAIICRTYKEAIAQLQTYILQNADIILDLDHDIQCKQTGYDIAKWVVNSEYQNLQFCCHSMNPVGRRNIIELLTHYGYKQYGRWL